MSDRWNSK